MIENMFSTIFKYVVFTPFQENHPPPCTMLAEQSTNTSVQSPDSEPNLDYINADTPQSSAGEVSLELLDFNDDFVQEFPLDLQLSFKPDFVSIFLHFSFTDLNNTTIKL